MDKQRLIFRGHVLDDTKLITENKIENNDVVHLIARLESNSNTNNSSNNNNSNPEENRNINENSFFSTFIRAGPPILFPFPFRDHSTIRSDRIFNNSMTNYRIYSSTYSNFNRISEFAPQPTINSDEIRETIAQNLLEVQNMIEFGNYDDNNEVKEINNKEEENNDINKNKNNNINEIYDMKCLKLDKRILAKGQWVDVKDTVEQWLDAQVIEVSEDNKMVKIHYNHWSTRWDEWIDTNSPRIMPFRYHTRQTTLTNYNSPFPNKKPDIGVTLLSFEDLNKDACLHPLNLSQQRIRANNSNNINNANNNTSNNNNTNNNNINNNNNNTSRRNRGNRYAEPLPPIPSPKHQTPDPENHLIKNLGVDGFIGIFNEFDKINKTIENLSSAILSEHNSNTEILTPRKLSEIQTKSYYNLKRLIPILDRTGRIYTDISAFFEHSIKTNHMGLISKNLFNDVEGINENLQYYTIEERRRISNEILGQNSRRENRSGTVNFVPPVNKFDTELKNYMPIIDTPYMIGKRDTQLSPTFDIFIQNNNEDEQSSNNEENNNINEGTNNVNEGNNNSNINNNSNNNDFLRNIAVEKFNMQINGNILDLKDEENDIENKKNKNGKILGNKTKRNKNINNNSNKDDKNEDNNEDKNEIDDDNIKMNKKKK